MTKDSNVSEPNQPEPVQPTEPEAPPKKPQRPALLVFTQSVLLLQGFVALFATLVLWSLARIDWIALDQWVALAGGLVLMLALFYASGKQTKKWGRILGWILQVPLLVAGFLEPAVAVMGGVFLILWIMALRLGSRIDRERKERDQAAQAKKDQAAAEGDADPA